MGRSDEAERVITKLELMTTEVTVREEISARRRQEWYHGAPRGDETGR